MKHTFAQFTLAAICLVAFTHPAFAQQPAASAPVPATEPAGDDQLANAPELPPQGIVIHPRPESADHYFVVHVPAASLYQCTVDLHAAKKDQYPEGSVGIDEGDEPRYAWRFAAAQENRISQYVFYAVLDPGIFSIHVQLDSNANAADSCTLRFVPMVASVSAQTRAKASAALGKSLQWLAKQKTGPGDQPPEISDIALIMAALSEDKDANLHKRVDSAYTPWLAAQFEDAGQAYKGRPLQRAGPNTYRSAVAALALAEAAAAGHESAKAPCAKLIDYLLAIQLSERRPADWNPIDKAQENYGGWRYNPDSTDADISVTGWCVVALIAADAADIHNPDMRRAIDIAMAYVSRCTVEGTFVYQVGQNDPGDIRTAIGALLFELYAEDSPAFEDSLRYLQKHLPQGTQVDRGENYPLYYAYYCTRINYLAGGHAWLNWRACMIDQLTRLQNPDGSFMAFGSEKDLGPAYSTSLGEMILRMCLDDVPAYLKQEVKGF